MKTTKKVSVKNGTRYITRTVFEEDGREYFKHNNEKCYIYQREDGKIFSPWFTRVEYITDEQ